MPTYRIIDAQGHVTNTILASPEFITSSGLSAVLVEDNTVQATAAPMSKLAFFERFTNAEQAAIYSAAKVHVSVEVWLDKFRLASDIDPSDPRTMAGVQALEAAGLIAAGRAAQILG